MKPSRTWAGVLLCVALAAAGCSGNDKPGDAGSPSATSTMQEPAAPPTFKVAPVVKVGRVVGRISKKHQESAERQISRAVMRWIDQAYLSTDQSTVRRAFAGFSRDMKKRAFHDRSVMSNAGIGGISKIVPSTLHITTDMLGVKGLPTGATSRIDLRYKTIGDQRRHVSVGGRVSLVHDPHGWQVISYDVHRGVR